MNSVTSSTGLWPGSRPRRPSPACRRRAARRPAPARAAATVRQARQGDRDRAVATVTQHSGNSCGHVHTGLRDRTPSGTDHGHGEADVARWRAPMAGGIPFYAGEAPAPSLKRLGRPAVQGFVVPFAGYGRTPLDPRRGAAHRRAGAPRARPTTKRLFGRQLADILDYARQVQAMDTDRRDSDGTRARRRTRRTRRRAARVA